MVVAKCSHDGDGDSHAGAGDSDCERHCGPLTGSNIMKPCCVCVDATVVIRASAILFSFLQAEVRSRLQAQRAQDQPETLKALAPSRIGQLPELRFLTRKR